MEQDNGRVFAAELVGTAVLLIGGPGTAILAGDAVGVLGIAIAFGLSLMIMAYVIGPVSGCHINPAVTLALLLTRKISAAHALFSVAGQIIGAAIGGAIILGIANGRDDFERGAFAANRWSGEFAGLGSAIVVEVVLTALLVVVVLATSTAKFAEGFQGMVAGFTLMLIHLISIPVDNTSVNPARSFGTAIYATLESDALEQLWAFIVFPLVGAVVGVVIWLVIDDSRLESTMLAEVPGMVEARDAFESGSNEVVDGVEDAIEDVRD